MALSRSGFRCSYTLLLFLLSRTVHPGSANYSHKIDSCAIAPPPGSYQPMQNVSEQDANLLLLALNLEYLEAELFLFAGYGKGLDYFAPQLADKGPPPYGAQLANLDALTKEFIQQFGLQEVGHIRAIKATVARAFPRVALNLTKEVFAETMEKALGKKGLSKPFDAYADSISFLLASYLVPYVGLTGYVGANPQLTTPTAKRLVAGLLAVESGQDAQIRALLYKYKDQTMYGMTVAEITNKLSALRNELGNTGVVDEGLTVPACLGGEGKIKGNGLAGDRYSVGYARMPEQILGIVYGSGNPSRPGGFYPQGGRGYYAEKYLKHRY